MHQDLLDRTEHISKAQQNSTDFIISSLRGVEVRNFDNDAEFFQYMNERVAQAKKQVEDISWSPEVNITPGLDLQEILDEEYRKVVTQLAQKIPFREILIFYNRPGRIQKLRNRIRDNWPGYSCVYFKDTEIPLLQFMIIDSEEVFILSDLPNIRNLAIRHPDIVKLFGQYYEILWQRGRKLKYGKTVYWDEVEKILGKSEVASLQAEIQV